jgi:flagellar basal body-associated protein FliL
LRRSIAILWIASLWPGWAMAEADPAAVPPRPEPSVTLEAPIEVDLGSPVDVIVTVTTATGDDAAVPEQAFGPFEILDTKVSVEPNADGLTQTFSFELQLISFEAGAKTLPPLTIRVASPSGELQTLQTEARNIDVVSVIANEPNPELRPPSEPVRVEQDDYTLLVILGVLLAMAVGALLAWLFLRWWRKREKIGPKAAPPPPPWETALAELRGLKQHRAAMVQEGRTEAWVDAVSDTIRHYLGERFGFHGLESTTDEIGEKLRRASGLQIEPREALVFLGECDLVKFARASLADEASETLLNDAFQLVDRTRPVAQTGDVV